MTTRDGASREALLARQKELREEQRRVIAEIRAYPGPITGCDAQFNFLLERRSAIPRELRVLDDQMSDEKEVVGG